MKNRKAIYITAGVILLLVIIVVSLAVLIRQKSKTSSESTNISQVVDKNKHIGVAGVATKGAVEKAFKGLAKDVSGPKQTGTLIADSNFDGEAARYTLKTEKNNRTIYVDINVLAYINKDELNKAKPFAGTSKEVISGLGDEAHYFTPRQVAADSQTAVIVVKDATSYRFSLMQNSNDGIDITETAAKKALVDLAKQSRFNIKK